MTGRAWVTIAAMVAAGLVGCGDDARSPAPDHRAAAQRAVAESLETTSNGRYVTTKVTCDEFADGFNCVAKVRHARGTRASNVGVDGVTCSSSGCTVPRGASFVGGGPFPPKPRAAKKKPDAKISAEQLLFEKLDDLAVEIDPAIAAAVDASLGQGDPATAGEELRRLYRRARKLTDPLLLDDSPFTVPGNEIAGAAFNARAALQRGDTKGVVRQRAELAAARQDLAAALAE